jgi:large subunit ribosomal protein L7/L12
MALSNQEILDAIKEKKLTEIAELVKMMEEEFGVSAAPVAVAGAAPGAAAPGAAPVEEKNEFTVILKEIGKEKIKVIKEVRAITNLGLKEAKDLVEGAPKEVVKDVPKEEAEKVKKQLEAVGAGVEIK